MQSRVWPIVTTNLIFKYGKCFISRKFSRGRGIIREESGDGGEFIWARHFMKARQVRWRSFPGIPMVEAALKWGSQGKAEESWIKAELLLHYLISNYISFVPYFMSVLFLLVAKFFLLKVVGSVIPSSKVSCDRISKQFIANDEQLVMVFIELS